MASKIGKALGFTMDMGETPREKHLGMGEADIPDTSPDSSPDMSGPESESMEKPKGKTSAETLAMKLFDKASDPESKVEAFKSLLEACGVTSGY